MKNLEDIFAPTSTSDPHKDYTNVKPDVEFNPLNHLRVPTKVPEAGFMNVRWSHAIPELVCNGCRLKESLEDRFRYTCRTCGPNQFDLCKFCFKIYRDQRAGSNLIYSTTGNVIDHDRTHEIVEMDLCFPNFEDPIWHQGMGPAALQIMTQVGSKQGAWGPEAYKSGDKTVIDSLAKHRSVHGIVLADIMTHVSFNGINVSSAAVKAILSSATGLEVLHFRSTPKFGGPELINVFKEVLDENPLGLQQLHTIYATGCNFFDFRTNDPTKARDYGQELRKLIDERRPTREMLESQMEDPVKSGLMKKRSKWNPFGGSKDKKRLEELKRETDYLTPPTPNIRVILNMCNLAMGMTNKCGFPGLIPTATYAEREPIHCYNQTRDLLLEVLTYLGTPGTNGTRVVVDKRTGSSSQHPVPPQFDRGARLYDLVEERARLVEFRKKRFLEHASAFAGPLGYQRMPLEWRAEVEKVLAVKVAEWSHTA